MPSRAELVLRADAVGFDPATIANDSKLEQHVIYLEKNAVAIAGTLGTGVFTGTGDLAANDTIVIGDVTYTFVTALSEVKATSTLTSSGVASDGETVTVAGVTYTFKTTLTNTAPNEVLIGASAAASLDKLDNLKIAINASGGTEGTEYSIGTVAHPEVTAEANADTTQEVTAKRFGTYGNAFETTETCADFAWDGAVLAGGVDVVANEIALGAALTNSLDNMKQAINAGDTEGALEGEGTNYSTGTRPHAQVTATTNTATAQTVQARDMAVTNANIPTTNPVDGGGASSWGATTLASGVADQNAVDATAAAQTSGDANKNI
ncbi:MAG: hypothetical protein ACXABY_20805 [Candidatus Thorarchaeota archaeon]|jgi:hypothetical protein